MLKIKHDESILDEELLNQGPQKTATSTPKQSFLQETLFQTNAYQDFLIQPTSFSLHNQHYGKLNNKNLSIIPLPERLAVINSELDLSVLDFVSDAYLSFFQELQSYKVKNKISNTSKIFNFQAKGTKEDLEEKYDLFLSDQYSYFLDFVNNTKLIKSIIDLDSFIDVFSKFIDSRTPLTPYHKSTFLYSNRVSSKVTGLVINLDNGDPNDDKNKFDNYINNEDFECYQDLANSYGFVINKDIPWQIVADLNSVNMKYYFHLQMLKLLKQGVISKSPVPTDKTRFADCKDALESFDLTNFIFGTTSDLKYFKILNYNDLNNLKNTIYYFYNSFVEYQPKNTIKEIIKKNNELKINQKTQTRKLVDFTELETQKFKNKLIKLYVYIKAKEINANWNQSKFNSIVTKSIQIYNALDTERMVDYIQRETAATHRSKVKQQNFYF